MSDENQEESALFPERVGDRLRVARTKAGLDLSDIATKTRVPLRHLKAIEDGDYASLPSPTYCVGFAKAYARAVGEDEVELAASLRRELGQMPPEERYEPHFVDEQESGPVPSRKLAVTAAIVGVLVVAAIWYGSGSMESRDTPALVTEQAEEPETLANSAAPSAPVAPSTGEVVLTAKETVWIRVYDAADKVLFEKEMTPGERYAVPGDANKPMIRTGRADLLTVTVGGKEVAPLGPAERTIKDVELSAASLAARAPVPSAAPALSNSAAPAP